MNNEGVPYAIGTPGLNFNIRVNRNGAFDIEARNGSYITIDVGYPERFVTQIRTNDRHELWIHDKTRMYGDQMTSEYSVRPWIREPANFRLILRGDQYLRRIDARYWNHSWTTTIMSLAGILTHAVKGAEACQALQDALEMAYERGRRHQRLNEPPSNNFGLALEHVSRENRLRVEREERMRQRRAENAPSEVIPDVPIVPESPSTGNERSAEPENTEGHDSDSVQSTGQAETAEPVDTTLDDDNASAVTPDTRYEVLAYETPRSVRELWQHQFSSDDERYDLPYGSAHEDSTL